MIMSKKSNALELIFDWRRKMGFKARTLNAKNDSENQLSIKLIQEEIQELCNANAEEDVVEVQDAIGDLLFVICQAADSFGVNLEHVVRKINDSNMTKLITNKQQLAASFKFYQQKNEIVEAVKVQHGWVLKREDGKIMKPAHYQAPKI